VTRQAIRVAHLLSAAASAAHAHDVTMLQVRIIAAVAATDRATVTEIATALRVSAPTVSVPTDSAVRAGFLARVVDDQDRRKWWLTVTPAGHALIVAIDDAFRLANKLSPRRAA
jgi:DNA-binding MarR family transcriptional regulator